MAAANFMSAESRWKRCSTHVEGKKLGGSEFVDGRLLAALRVFLSNDKEEVRKHDLNTVKSLSAEAPLEISNKVAVLCTIIASRVITLPDQTHGRQILVETEYVCFS